METMNHDSKGKHYGKLAIMAVLSFISMYILMYSMVDRFDNVVLSTNQFYMAGLMAMPTIIIEILLMRSMYMDSRKNAIVIGLSIIGLVGFFFAIRQQTAIDDKQFLKSMIPHHAGAILMCQESDINNPEIKKLCEEIVASQQKEIQEMKSKLREMDQ